MTHSTPSPAAEPPIEALSDDSLVVGIGASAGGLGALKAFFSEIPADAGFAILLVRHLGDGDHPLVIDTLAPLTRLPVVVITDGMPILANRVHITPIESVVTLKDGRFRLGPPRGPGQRRAPIDRVLQMIASVFGPAAVGVVLSGDGSDGALGLEAIGGAGGLTMAQDVASATHSEMPESAVASGFADYVLPPAELARALLTYASHWRDSRRGAGADQERRELQSRLTEICDVLRQRTGQDFKHYKTSTLVRRLTRRMQVLHLDSVDSYIGRLTQDAQEPQILFRELLIAVTSFFRDGDAFAALAEHVLRPLIEQRASNGQIRIWVPGCASGEEAYSIAILMRELMDTKEAPPQVQIFATDINERAIAAARRGSYPQGIVAQLSPERLARFFVKRGRRYQIAKEVRELCLFSVHNVISDPPFSRQDLISCRNLLIYLGAHLQKKLIPVFHYALRPGGYLFLGASESLAGHGELFRSIDVKHRIAQRKETRLRAAGQLRDFGGAGLPGWREPTGAMEPDLGAVAQRILLDEFAPRYAIVTEDGQVVFLSDGVDKYLQQPSGSFSSSITRMARRGLSVALRAAFSEAARIRRMVSRDVLSVQTAEGVQAVRLIVQPMPELGHDTGLYMVVFQDIGAAVGHGREDGRPQPEADAVIEQLERELLRTREDLERTVQDLEAANEELKSSNEELLSMNEELQSANEELESSKEEVQTTNQALAAANADLENLLRSTLIATIFLDRENNIRGFTPAASEIYNLTSGDIGRPLHHFTHRLRDLPPLPSLDALAGSTVAVEHAAQADDGRWFLRRVLPYHSATGATDGVVVTFVDITRQKQAEARERDRLAEIEAFYATAPIGLCVFDTELRFVRINEHLAEINGYPAKAHIGKTVREMVPDLSEQAEALLRRILDNGEAVLNIELVGETAAQPGVKRIWNESWFPLRNAEGRIVGINVVAEEITKRKRDEERLKLLASEVDHRAKNMLAIVQAMVRLTRAETAQEFADALLGRIAALGRAHTLLAQSRWDGADLARLVSDELAPYTGGGASRASFKGPRVALAPHAAQSVAMTLHELATNAAKYGALSSPDGHVAIEWMTEPKGSMTLRWAETGGPRAEPPKHRGLGTSVIERTVKQQIGGDVHFDWRPEGLVCTLSLPMDALTRPMAPE